MGCWGESMLFDNYAMYTKWTRDIREAQREDGCIPDVAPAYWNYYSDNVTWPAALPMACDMLFTNFGDKRPIEENYPAIKKWVSHIREYYMTEDFIITKDKYGDWCVPPESLELIHSKDPSRKTDGALIATAYYLKVLQLMHRFASLQGLKADAEEWEDLEHRMKDAFNARFLHVKEGTSPVPGHTLYPDSIFYGNNTVTANILPLAFGLVPKNYINEVAKNAVTSIITTNKGHISTGVIGVQWLLRELSRRGHDLSRCDLLPDATCTKPGRVVGTCARCGVKIDEVIPAKGHDYSYADVHTDPTCTEPGHYKGTCPRCGKDYNDTIPALGHDWGEWVVTQEPTYTTTGYRYHICARCNTRVGEDIPKLRDHTWDSGIVTTKPDCIHAGVRTYTCTDCGATKTETIPATGEHTFVAKEIPATCTTGGYILCTCSVCGTTQRYDASEPLGHKWNSGTVTTKPTEDMAGVRTYTCTVCGDTKTETIPATGVHMHTWQLTKRAPATCTEDGYDLYTCAKCGAVEHRNEVAAFGHKMNAGEVVIKPTATTSGVRVYTCSVCGETKAETIPATGLPSVCPGGPTCPGYAFRDMPAPDSWAHAGLDYCIYSGYINGLSATTVDPSGTCTRAQLVCILYRIQGEPKVVEGYELAKLRAPFDDVPRGQWYTNAILWAKLTGIVNGTSATTFDPSGQITREQLAAILYRYTAKYAPDATGNAASLAAYPDAGSVSAYARDAMAWAVGNGLIKGLPHDKTDYLEPGGSTTRAQVATILMRYKQATA